ncbi:MAG: 16S rRNA (uracil(1498)-N(3))-methyltransferase [Paracoccaceae bacterium]
MASSVRLYVEHPLGPGQRVPLAAPQAHYLLNVMRLAAGAEVLAFNGRDGEWRAALEPDGRRGGALACLAQTRPQGAAADLWLLFAPLKKARTDFLVEKAVELGAGRLLPVDTAFTSSERVREDRLRAHAVEAAEQCGATTVPEVAAIAPLAKVLAGWPGGRRLWFCDEAEGAAGGPAALAAFAAAGPGPAAILTGPEGGFSEAERARLRQFTFVSPVSLGPRILRAETAALAALTLWQAAAGDWR